MVGGKFITRLEIKADNSVVLFLEEGGCNRGIEATA
jgi:hypothetical protein